MSTGTPWRVSVVIPTWGRAESVVRLLHALREQRNCLLDVVLVDQNAPGWLTGQLPPDLLYNVRLVQLAEPNVAAARNVGFRAATADIVLFIDDDVVPSDQFCSQAAKILHSQPAIGCLCPVVYGEEGQPTAVRALKRRRTRDTLDGERLLEIEDTVSAAIFFRREYFVKTGGFDDLLYGFARAAEDQELFLRMRLRGLSAWADLELAVYHDEQVGGGCEMRSRPYWVTRAKCVRSWAYRYRVHGDRSGALGWRDIWRLLRSAVLNRGAIRQGPRALYLNGRLLAEAISTSGRFVRAHLGRYDSVLTSDHISVRPEAR